MNLDNSDIMTGGGIIAAIVGAFTTVKVGLYNKMSYGKHEEICKGVRKDLYEKIDDNHKETITYLMEIQKTLGRLEGSGK